MVDFHTHILPGIDDGSSSVDESLKMLEIQLNQGVDTVVATPHFNMHNSKNFFENRTLSFESVTRAAKESSQMLPKILLGAEVMIERNICQYPNLTKLCIEGTNVMLLELPFLNWCEKWVFEEIFNIEAKYKIVPVIAHINRYIKNPLDANLIRPLFDMDVYFQINTDLCRTQKKIMKMLIESGHAHLVGSDCHNLTDRAPNLMEDLSYLGKKYGKELIDIFEHNALGLLNLL